MDFLGDMFYGNPLQDWLIAAVLVVAAVSALRFLIGVVARHLAASSQPTQTPLDDLVARLLSKTKLPFLLLIAVFLASLTLDLSELTGLILRRVALIALVLQGAIWTTDGVTFLLARYREQRLEEDASAVTTMTALGFVAKVAVWTVAVLLILDNFGIQVTALVTGLGIGGIAVALALQSILGDLFASLAIVLDKPFVIGDFLKVDEFLGNVEYIGLKTTRIRSLSGEQVILSNSDLLGSRVRNFGRMYERRVVFTVGVTYETPREKLVKIPEIMGQAVKGQDSTRLDRAHWKGYGDFSLDFETVYYVTQPDYAVYMDVQQAINLEVHRRFQEEGIEFAYPTQTIYARGLGGQREGVEAVPDS
jgi:small-conductance mechanosensitive channel